MAVGMLALVACASCNERGFDDLSVCFPPAMGRIVVEVRAPCAADHRGAELECSVDVDGSDVHVTASGHDGHDPDGGCSADLTATCDTDVLADGLYTVHFDDEVFEVSVPNTDESSCEDEI